MADAPSPVIVSYHTSPSADVWERIQLDLHRQLPLRNLSWKPSSRPPRSITSLQVSFQPLRSTSSSLSSPPLVHILFVACDDNEAYKTVIKQEIKAWLDLIQSTTSEWLIVHVSTAPKPANAAAGIFRTKTGVLDKLKADFNPPKKERCIQLSYLSTMDSIVHASLNDSATQWSELISRLKDSLLLVLDSKVSEMEESLRMLDSKRGRHGWEFETFFIQKAQLANQFEIMNLLEDSLVQYDELDAAFFQSLKDHSEQYLELVGSGQLAIFDLRIYLFSKQASLLGRLSRLAEAINRGTVFVATFSAFLRPYQNQLPQNFLESWVYCTCTDLAEWCERQVHPGADDVASLECMRRCSQLLELAHNQLDKIGITAGYLPSTHPFNMSLVQCHEPPSQHALRPVQAVTKRELMDASKDPVAYEKLYIDLASRTINLYQLTGHRRSALKLHCKIAALEQVQQRDEPAQRLYAHLPAHYVDDRWTMIESSLLDRCATLQKSLGMSKELLLSTLALVRSGVTYEPGKWSQNVMLHSSKPGEQQSIMEQKELAQRLIQDIRDQAMKLEKDFAAIGYPTFSIALGSQIGSLPESVEGSIVQAKITNILPCSVEVNAVRMKFSGSRYDTLWFTTGACTIEPGETTVDLFCATPVAENLVLDVSQLRISRIIFQYHHRPSSSSSPTNDPKLLQMVSFAKDPRGLDVKLDLPDYVLFGGPRTCILTLDAGRNRLAKAFIKMTSESPVEFDLEHSKLGDPSSCGEIVGHPDMLQLTAVEARSELTLTVPFSTSTKNPAEIDIVVEYRIEAEADVKRSFRKKCSLNITMPLDVDIHNIFRPTAIITKFTVGTDGQDPLRLWGTEVEVDSPAGSRISIRPARPSREKPIAVLPSQTSNFIFKISSEDFLDTQETPLKLVIKYRMLVDEIMDHLEQKLDEGLLSDQKLLIPSLSEYVKGVLSALSYDRTFYLSYTIDQSLDLKRLGKSLDWNSATEEIEKDEEKRRRLVDRINLALEDSSIGHQTCRARWRSFALPYNFPSIQILTTIKYEGLAGLGVKVGEPMGVELVLSTSFRWCRSSEERTRLKSDPPRLVFEVLNDTPDWLVGGCKRGSFLARDEEPKSMKLTLVPLKPGALNLPRVSVEVVQPEAGWQEKAARQSQIKIETHHLNLAETVMVMPKLLGARFKVVGLDSAQQSMFLPSFGFRTGNRLY